MAEQASWLSSEVRFTAGVLWPLGWTLVFGLAAAARIVGLADALDGVEKAVATSAWLGLAGRLGLAAILGFPAAMGHWPLAARLAATGLAGVFLFGITG